MTQTELNAQLAAGDTRLYAKMPIQWADMEVDESMPDWSIVDEEGEFVRAKTYREYLLFLAENDDFVLAKLLEQDPNTCFTKTLEKPERDKIIAMIGLPNIMSHNEALAERDRMNPQEEM